MNVKRHIISMQQKNEELEKMLLDNVSVSLFVFIVSFPWL